MTDRTTGQRNGRDADAKEPRFCQALTGVLQSGAARFALHQLTNAHSKSPRHHEAAVALWITLYNFGRVHSTLKTTPAVKAGLTDSVWNVERLLNELTAAA